MNKPSEAAVRQHVKTVLSLAEFSARTGMVSRDVAIEEAASHLEMVFNKWNRQDLMPQVAKLRERVSQLRGEAT